MTHYCSLFIRSDHRDEAVALFMPDVVDSLEFEDLHSSERLARSQGLRSVGLVMRSDSPRYWWALHSRDAVGTSEMDLQIHVAWLLSQLIAGINLGVERARGVECSLGCFWGGRGTGGGPFVSPALAQMLLKHQLGLDVGFYFEAGDNAV
jgi:hypothetical protein